MTRKQDLQNFFISANTAQDYPNFDLDKFTEDYLGRNQLIPDEELNAATQLHVDRIKSSFRDKPIAAKKEAANAKFHFQEGMRAVLKIIQDGQ